MAESSVMQRFWAYLKDHFPRVHGNRGTTMLGFAIVAFGFGTAYAWPGVLPPASFSSNGTELVRALLPLQIWGVIWYVAGVSLLSNAFRVEQSKAMGFITGLFSAWTISALHGFVLSLMEGKLTSGWLLGLIYAGLVVACFGIAKAPNPAKTHIGVVNLPGEKPSERLLGATGEMPVVGKNEVG